MNDIDTTNYILLLTQSYPYPKLNTKIWLYYCKTDVEGEVVEMCEVSLKSGS